MAENDYTAELKRVLAKALDRIAVLEKEAGVRPPHQEIGVVKGATRARQTGGKVVAAPRTITSGIKKASQAKGKTGIFDRAIREGKVSGT